MLQFTPRPSLPTNLVSDEDRVRLESEVTEADIKRGLWSLKAWKAPGPRVFLMFLAHSGEICGKGG